MRRRLTGGVAITAVIAALIGASAAPAATEFGNSCVANNAVANVTLFQIAGPGDPLPVAAPSAGVITNWRVNLIGGAPPAIATTLKVLRLNTGAKSALLVAESSGSVFPGANTFPARIPIQPGDRLGLFGPSPIGTLYCVTGVPGTIGVYPGGGSVGAAALYEEGTSPIRVPVVAVVEPDADNDGFGDETQDGCPQSPLFQVPCPTVTVDASSQVGRNAVTVLVTTNIAAPVQVTGTVKLGKGKKATLKAAARTVTPGTLAKFRLNFNKKLRDRLKELSPNQKLTLKISASATNVVGQVSTDKVNAKLKGQG